MLLTARSGLGATLHVSLLVSSYPVYELFFLGCFLSADDHGSTLQPPPVPAAGFLSLIFLLFGNVRGVAVVWTLFFLRMWRACRGLASAARRRAEGQQLPECTLDHHVCFFGFKIIVIVGFFIMFKHSSSYCFF
jgi:hypothetical protein